MLVSALNALAILVHTHGSVVFVDQDGNRACLIGVLRDERVYCHRCQEGVERLDSPVQPQCVEMLDAQEKLVQDKPHEEYAELLNRQFKWQQAETFWLLAVHEAKQHQNWSKWSRCLLNSGLMALSIGQFTLAERRFKEVIDTPQVEVSMLAVVEAYIRLGWLYYEQDKFSQARHMLLKSRTHLQHLVNENVCSLSFPEHGCTLLYEGNELIMALESSRLHWSGRTYIDWGIQQDDQKLVQEGVVRLQKAANYDKQLGLPINRGFELLRQIPALLYQGELDMTARYLAECEELLHTPGKGNGHFYLHKGLAFLEEQPKKSKDLLESAHENFAEPPFYLKGVSEVFKEISVSYLMDNKKTGDEIAFEYALATTVLHPYGRNVENLQVAAHKMYWRLGEDMTAFNKSWFALEEKLWRMESGPFLDFRYMMQSFPENGIHHIEIAIEEAKKAVYKELSL